MNPQGTPKLATWEVAELVSLKKQGYNRRYIAREFGISLRTVSRYLHRVHRCGHCKAQFATARDLLVHCRRPA